MGRFLTAALLIVLALPAFAQAPSQTFTISGTLTITSLCTITSVSLPTSFTGPVVNHGMTVGPVSFTSDIPCATPPTAILTGSQFALAGTTLPTTLIIGNSDLVAGTYTVSGTAQVPVAGTATFRAAPVQK